MRKCPISWGIGMQENVIATKLELRSFSELCSWWMTKLWRSANNTLKPHRFRGRTVYSPQSGVIMAVKRSHNYHVVVLTYNHHFSQTSTKTRMPATVTRIPITVFVRWDTCTLLFKPNSGWPNNARHGVRMTAWIQGWSLQWRQNGRDGVSNHQPRDCLLNRLLRHRSKNSPHKGQVTRKMFPFDDVIMTRLAPSQWETSLQSNDVSHWPGTSLKSAQWIPLQCLNIPYRAKQSQIIQSTRKYSPLGSDNRRSSECQRITSISSACHATQRKLGDKKFGSIVLKHVIDCIQHKGMFHVLGLNNERSNHLVNLHIHSLNQCDWNVYIGNIIRGAIFSSLLQLM